MSVETVTYHLAAFVGWNLNRRLRTKAIDESEGDGIEYDAVALLDRVVNLCRI
jgi:hypothetical protein